MGVRGVIVRPFTNRPSSIPSAQYRTLTAQGWKKNKGVNGKMYYIVSEHIFNTIMTNDLDDAKEQLNNTINRLSESMNGKDFEVKLMYVAERD